MDLQTRVSILQVFLGVGLVGFAYAHMYRKTRTDRYREDLFTLRDALFDYMWENRVPFDLPAYRLTRQLLNGAIRAADSVSLWSLLLVAVFVRRQQWHEDRLSVALDAIPDPALRSHFRDVRVQFGHRLGRFLVAEGILGPFLALAWRLATVREWVEARLRPRAERWNEPLVAFGSDESPAMNLFRKRRARFRFRHP